MPEKFVCDQELNDDVGIFIREKNWPIISATQKDLLDDFYDSEDFREVSFLLNIHNKEYKTLLL